MRNAVAFEEVPPNDAVKLHSRREFKRHEKLSGNQEKDYQCTQKGDGVMQPGKGLVERVSPNLETNHASLASRHL